MLDSNCWRIIASYVDKWTFLNLRTLSKSINFATKITDTWWSILCISYEKMKALICDPQCIKHIYGMPVINNISIVITKVPSNDKEISELVSFNNIKTICYDENKWVKTKIYIDANAGYYSSHNLIYSNYDIVLETNIIVDGFIRFNYCMVNLNGFTIKAKRIILHNTSVNYKDIILSSL